MRHQFVGSTPYISQSIVPREDFDPEQRSAGRNLFLWHGLLVDADVRDGIPVLANADAQLSKRLDPPFPLPAVEVSRHSSSQERGTSCAHISLPHHAIPVFPVRGVRRASVFFERDQRLGAPIHKFPHQFVIVLTTSNPSASEGGTSFAAMLSRASSGTTR